MITKIFLVTTFCLLGGISKAQFLIYEPATPSPSREDNRSSSKTESSIINAYTFNSENNPIKIKLKVSETSNGIYIVAYKKLTDYTWIEFGRYPYQAAKVPTNSKLSEYFEYEVYIPSLQKKVYF